MSDRSIRNLANLQLFGSTARVLNLLSVWKQHGKTLEWAEAPLFHTRGLNRAIIIKHRIRRDELDLFRTRRQVATKILLPIDDQNLRLGARFIYIGQIQFEQTLREYFGISIDEHDLRTLTLLDKLPSLDPFLMREQLKRHGVEASRCYFELTEADLRRMFEFVEAEIRPLVAMSLQGAGGKSSDTATATLVSKILSNADGDEMKPLRETLQLAQNEYAEGVFCWKGFLYYKWSLASILVDVGKIANEIATVAPVGPMDHESRTYIERGKRVLRSQVLETCRSVLATIGVYDDAYANLTNNGRPAAFREFLLDAPSLFTRLGEQVGAVQHIVSFWSYRMAAGKPRLMAEELIDLLSDFETSLSGRERPDAVALAA